MLMASNENSRFLKLIILAALFGLGLIAVLEVVSYVYVDKSIRTQEVNSFVMNSAGQRRWLSQRIALEALHIVSSENPAEKEYLRVRLSERLNDLEKVHHWLINGDHPFSLDKGMSRELRSLYFDAPNHLDSEIKQFIVITRKLIEESRKPVEHDDFHLTYILNNAEGHLLSELDTAVRRYQSEGEAMVLEQRKLMRGFLFLTLSALLIVAVFIFWPLARYVNREAMELHIARQKAEESTRLKDKFVSMVAHDLRSPFTSMLGLFRMMDENGDGAQLTERQRLILERVVKSGEGLLKMIDELLSINRFQTGKILIRPRFLDARSIMGLVINSLEHSAKAKNIELSNDIPSNKRIWADMELIQQVFMNLVSNAIKFTKPGGKIVVYVPDDSVPVIAIKDTGVGMTENMLSKIFRYEEKTSTTGTAGERGSGLGLPLSAEIVLAHGGMLRAESRPGQGSVFYVELPEKKPLALVVDDMEINRLSMSSILSKARMDVMSAENGKRALKIIAERKPDIIVSDIHMPTMNGLDFLSYIQKDPILKDTPVLVVSADAEDGLRERAIIAGAADFMTHPIQPEEFLSRARRLVDIVKN